MRLNPLLTAAGCAEEQTAHNHVQPAYSVEHANWKGRTGWVIDTNGGLAGEAWMAGRGSWVSVGLVFEAKLTARYSHEAGASGCDTITRQGSVSVRADAGGGGDTWWAQRGGGEAWMVPSMLRWRWRWRWSWWYYFRSLLPTCLYCKGMKNMSTTIRGPPSP